MKSRSASKIKLTSYDDLLGGTAALEDIREVAIDELHSFAGGRHCKNASECNWWQRR